MEVTERLNEKAFSNGDVHIGNFMGNLPHGKGKYTWSDRTIYEGDWELGKLTGKGCMIWPSGAKYEGDISGGYLHGLGTFSHPNGTIYNGAWRMNIHHGVGKKQYSNGDFYEGSWKEGVYEGCGRYTWILGTSYVGNWKGGKMWGKGVMKWENGDLFCGFWINGLRHGSGVYRFGDGGYYFGTWSKGLKEGKGTFYPAGSKPPLPLEKLYGSVHYGDIDVEISSSNSLERLDSKQSKGFKKTSVNRSFSAKIMGRGNSKRGPNYIQKQKSLSGDPVRDDLIHEESQSSEVWVNNGNGFVYDREYVQGVLINERIRRYEDVVGKSKLKNKFTIKEGSKNSCVNILESRQSYYLMLNLQLGIRYTVGKITPIPQREVRATDFGERARIKVSFPRKGSQLTPPHYSVDFHWKDYCPMVFRNLREMFKLDAAEYMMSICGDDGLRELSSSGKSGSLFYLSHDDRFVIKTLKKPELKVLLKMLQQYYQHVGEHENTLITKFFGLHRIALKGGRKVRFVVMGNMFCTELKIHRRYDLKGSTHGRFTNEDKIEENTTLKDLDLAYEFHMDKLLRESLFKQISLDCQFLKSQQIIDYSLLLGLHFRAPEHLKAFLDSPSGTHDHENSPTSDGASSQWEQMIPPKSILLVTHEPSSVSTEPGPHIRGSTLKAYSLGDKEVDLLLPGTARLRVQLGVNMPAQATHKVQQEGVDSPEVELLEVYDVVLYMGIIDILQDYNVRKKLEHVYKARRFDPLTISVVDPCLYAQRFIKFLEKSFHDLP